MRPLFARALADHEALLTEARATRYLCKDGWLKVYRSQSGFAAVGPELLVAQEFGISHRLLDREGVQALEPNLGAVVHSAVFWPGVASISNPLAVTRAYAARFAHLGGIVVAGDARSLHRSDGAWRVETGAGPIDGREVVMALGPFAPDVLVPLGIDLPLAVTGALNSTHNAFGVTWSNVW